MILLLRDEGEIVLLVATVLMLSICRAANIGVMYPGGSKSHLFAVMPIVEELAKRGHNITIVSAYKLSTDNGPIRQIHLADLEKLIEAFTPDMFAMSKQGPTQVFSMFSSMRSLLLDGYELMMENREFQSFLEARDTDLFLADALDNAILPVMDRLKVPIVLHSSCNGIVTMLKPMGATMNYASVPTPFTDFDDKMTFGQRLMNAVQSEAMSLFMDWYLLRPLEEKIKTGYPDARPVSEIKKDISLLLINSHPATDWPRSLPPSVIPIGAIHTRPAKPLPEVQS